LLSAGCFSIGSPRLSRWLEKSNRKNFDKESLEWYTLHKYSYIVKAVKRRVNSGTVDREPW